MVEENALAEPHGHSVAVLERLKKRSEFLSVAKGKRFQARGLTLQAAPRLIKARSKSHRLSLEDRSIEKPAVELKKNARFGFTVTKRIGGAVQRNRIRRRLKEALRLLDPLPARAGYDYVIVAKPEALALPFRTLQAELTRALRSIPVGPKSGPRNGGERQDN
ncbi:MAG TPA: ribonuclease P protein component [Methylocella sp.]|nr:ribonuclease P protein component [Methylocella sp.]